jgi:hypothetical protein
MGYAGEPIVSIQRIDSGSAKERHLSWGVLADCDTVLSPPFAAIHDPDVDFEVLIASSYLDGSFKIERIAVRRIDLCGLRGHVRLAVPFFHLAQSSHHTGRLQEPQDLNGFLRTAAATGDAWEMLEKYGVIPTYVRRRRLSVLDVVVEEERRRRADLVVNRLREMGDVEFWPCCMVHWSCCRLGIPWPTDIADPGPEEGHAPLPST